MSKSFYKVGTRVKVVGKGLATTGEEGIVVKVEKVKGWPYTVATVKKGRFGPITSYGAYGADEIAKVGRTGK
jgi:hypothetical protein